MPIFSHKALKLLGFGGFIPHIYNHTVMHACMSGLQSHATKVATGLQSHAGLHFGQCSHLGGIGGTVEFQNPFTTEFSEQPHNPY